MRLGNPFLINVVCHVREKQERWLGPPTQEDEDKDVRYLRKGQTEVEKVKVGQTKVDQTQVQKKEADDFIK